MLESGTHFGSVTSLRSLNLLVALRQFILKVRRQGMSIPLQLFLWVSASIVMMSILIGVIRTGISPMPSSQRAVEQVLKFVEPPHPGPLYELGAAWGSLAIPLARAFPDRQIVAYELSTVPWLFLRLRIRLSKLDNIEVVRRDFFRADLSNAAVVICYLYPESMVRLSTKLKAELMAGTVVVSNTFALPGWVAEQQAVLKDLYQTKVYRFVLNEPSDA